MCGIAGILWRGPTERGLETPLAAMAHAMHHRGPDDGGLWHSPNGRLGLANRRLAIRDLSPLGHMPMGTPAGTLWISYNGEIYNTDELRPDLERLGYTFASQSDTEVILRGYEAWGERVVERLRGMFAFAIADLRAPHPRLFLARDRLGIKPLYYALTPDAFLFASELRALHAAGITSREVDPAGLVGYLLLGSVPVPLTIYRDVQALEPGCTLSLPLGAALPSPTPKRYWSLPTDQVPTTRAAEAVEQVRSLLAEAVRIRLVSDVPLGAFLSGGLDSSAVVALMRQATDGPIRTCSMVFEETPYSEAPYARAMVEAVGAEHFERVITAQDVSDHLDTIFQVMDQPTLDGVNTFFVSQTARQAGLTVALSGLGGDELFGGYPNTFGQVPRVAHALRVAQQLPGGVPIAQAALSALPRSQPWARLRDALARPASLASAYLTRRGLFAPSEVRALVPPDLWAEAVARLDPVQHVAERADGSPHPFEWVSRAELTTYTHHQLLRDTDVMSMAHSLEVRVPFLDHRLVEAVLRLPTATKLNGGTPKPLLLKAVADLLPESVRARRSKQGFTFPFERWLRGPLRERSEAALRGSADAPWLRQADVAAVWEGYQAGRIHWSRAWALVALASWLEREQR